MKDPEVMRTISEQFPKIAFGWEIEPEESVEFEIPVTHGIRFRSNEPCVSPIIYLSLHQAMDGVIRNFPRFFMLTPPRKITTLSALHPGLAQNLGITGRSMMATQAVIQLTISNGHFIRPSPVPSLTCHRHPHPLSSMPP